MSSVEKTLRLMLAGILLVGFAEMARSQGNDSSPATGAHEATETVPTLYISINMEAPQKVMMSVVEVPRPVEFEESQEKNPRYVRVAVRDRIGRDRSNPNDKGKLYGVVDAENPFLPIVDVGLLKKRSAKEVRAAEEIQRRTDKDPRALIGKLKLVLRLSLEGRENLIENVRAQRQASGVTEADLRARAGQRVQVKGSRIFTDAYSKALLEVYIKVVLPAIREVIDSFEIADDGQGGRIYRESLRQAKREFFDLLRDAALEESVIENLLKDYETISASRRAKAKGGQQ